MATTISDCNTCKHHVQVDSLYGIPHICRDCRNFKHYPDILLNWTPNTMSDGMTEAYKEEKEALKEQVGGNHYKHFKIQPVEFSIENNLNAIQHSIVKYAVRKKGTRAERMQDFDKIIHFAQLGKAFLVRGLDV